MEFRGPSLLLSVRRGCVLVVRNDAGSVQRVASFTYITEGGFNCRGGVIQYIAGVGTAVKIISRLSSGDTDFILSYSIY